jgi:hypothetical protein
MLQPLTALGARCAFYVSALNLNFLPLRSISFVGELPLT